MGYGLTVQVYTPEFTVTLSRIVQREGGDINSGFRSISTVDLTPYLGTAGVVRTSKSVNQAAGGFVVVFADKIAPEIADTAYGLIEPMDMIEIRASRQPYLFRGSKMPLIMRGFVSSITRSESVADDGRPIRSVIVNGQDSGKLWMINNILFEIALTTDSPYLSTFRLQAATGIDVFTLAVNDFMQQIVDKVMNPKIDQLNAFAHSQVKPFSFIGSVKKGLVLPQLIESMDLIPIWALAESFADKPWNELFIRDHEDGPVLIFRPVPYKNISDQSFILADDGAEDPGTVEVSDDDVVSLEVARSDMRVANFFWTPPGQSQLDTNGEVTAAALQNGYPLDFNYGNNHPAIFGVRRMQVETRLQPEEVTDSVNLLPRGDRQSAVGNVIGWAQHRSQQMALLNRDNSAFEEGSAVVKGSENFIIGQYFRLLRGSMRSEYYITDVMQSMAPLSTWSTSLQLIRGTGFVDRSKLSTSPAAAEGRSGPYSRP